MNIKKIQNELRRVTQFNEKNWGKIFSSQKYKNDLEWWILGQFCYCLEKAQKKYPIFANKRKNTNPPDFKVYNDNKESSGYLEVTETLKPGRKRSDEYKYGFADKNEFIADPSNLNSLLERINEKLQCKFNNTNLIIYFNISIFDISSCGAWHWVACNRIKNWIQNGELSYKQCNYNNIFILDSNGERLFKIYPSYELIYTPKKIEHIYELK